MLWEHTPFRRENSELRKNPQALGPYLAIVLTLLIVSAWYLLYVPESPLPGPIQSRRIQIGDRARTYLVFFPSKLKEGASVLFALHPSQSSGRTMRRIVGSVFESPAERDNVVLVYPNGYEGHFMTVAAPRLSARER